MQDPTTRARQHLLIQGFTLYTCEAAVAMLALSSGTLSDPSHAWSVEFDERSLLYTSLLPPGSPFAAELAEGAVAAAGGARHVLNHTQGGLLLVPLDVGDVRDSRMRIEAAVALGKAPPVEKLQAFGDEMLLAEARKRGLALRDER